jgi:hypothetical protein
MIPEEKKIDELTDLIHSKNLNTVTLRDYIEAKLEGIALSTKTALVTLDKRFDSINEIRGAMKDQIASFPTRNEIQNMIARYTDDIETLKSNAGTYVTRNEHVTLLTRLESDVRMLRESRAELAGKASQLYVNICLAISIIGLAISVLGLISKHI